MSKGIWHLVAGAVLSFAVFVVPPVSVYAPNAAEFTEPALSLLLPFIGLFIVGALIAGLISWMALFPPRLLVFYICCSAASLVLSQVFSSSAGIVIDGGFHEYQISTVRAAGEILTLVAVFLLGFTFKNQLLENRRFVAVVAGLWAVASVAVPAFHYLAPSEQERLLPLPDGLKPFTELSPDLNILHIMFDSFQSDAFSEILESSPALRDEFDGFVLYREHSGYSNWTSLSLPAILSGHLYFEEHVDDEQSANELIRRWMVEDSIMSRLQQRGFSVSAIQPGMLFCRGATYPCTVIPSNVDELKHMSEPGTAPVPVSDDGLSAGTLTLADLSLLRLAPTIVKPVIYDNGRLLLSRKGAVNPGDEVSLDDLSPIQMDLILSRNLVYYLDQNLRVSSEKPVYKFLHFYPPHKPFLLRNDCGVDKASVTIGGADPNWDNYLEQAGCAARLIARLMHRLKELGVYDDTIIVLQADTGLGMIRGESSNVGRIVTQVQSATQIKGYTAAELMAYAQPLLAIKPLGRHGPLTTSSELTHHRDMLSMLLRAANLGDEGFSALIGPTAGPGDRPRPFVLSDALRPATRRLAPFELLEIDGRLRDFANWSGKGIFVSPGEPLQPLQPIQAVSLVTTPDGRLSVGDTIELSAEVVGGEPSPLYLFFHRIGDNQFEVIQNWSPESQARWTVGSAHRHPCALELLVAARNEFALESQHVLAEMTLPLKRAECD